MTKLINKNILTYNENCRSTNFSLISIFKEMHLYCYNLYLNIFVTFLTHSNVVVYKRRMAKSLDYSISANTKIYSRFEDFFLLHFKNP